MYHVYLLSPFSNRGSCDKDEEQRTCYVTILPRPPHPPRATPTPNHSLSVHFKYDVLPPFPSFIPALSLRMPGGSCYHGDVVVTPTIILLYRYCYCEHGGQCVGRQLSVQCGKLWFTDSSWKRWHVGRCATFLTFSSEKLQLS